MRLAAYIVPLALASLFVTRDIVVRISTFAVGVALFGRPLLNRAQAYMMESELASMGQSFKYFSSPFFS